MKQFFGTDGIRGRVGGAVINPEFVLKLGWAIGRVLAQEGRGSVLIGKDTRISGYMLESALEAGLSAAGMDIRLLGPMPTPAVAYLTRTFHARAGIVVSASHNPYQDNGIKIFSEHGTKLSDELELAIEKTLQEPLQVVEGMKMGKASRIADAKGRYIEFCKNTLPPHTSLKGLKIVVDCAHGATYQAAPAVLSELGAEVIEIGVHPDGLNINLDSGSTSPDYLAKMVQFTKADVGIALDGDGDRVVMADHTGSIVDGDDLLYMMVKHHLDAKDSKHLAKGAVGTLMSNLGLEWSLKALGVEFVRTKVGDRYVIEELTRRGWSLGGEPSGHIVCLHLSTTGDGILAALQVLQAMMRAGCSLKDLRTGFTKLPQSTINVPMATRQDPMAHPKIQEAVKQVEITLGNRGRVLLRASGTEPVVRVMVEGENASDVGKMAEELALLVRQNVSNSVNV